MMAVYDDEQQKTGISEEELRKLTGISPDEEDAMDREAHNGAASDTAKRAGLNAGELSEAESDGATAGATGVDNKEKGALGDDDTVGSGFNKENGGRRFHLSRNKGIAGTLVALAIGGGFGMFSLLQGPLKVVHAAQVLQRFHMTNNEETADGRSSRFIRNLRNYMITGSVGGAANRSNLGRISNKFADRFEARFERETGLRSVYSRQTGRFLGYEIVNDNRSSAFLSDQEWKDDFENTPIRSIEEVNNSATLQHARTYGTGGQERQLTGRLIDLTDERYSNRRSFIRTVTRGTDTGRITGSMASRMLIRRAGIDFHPLKNVQRRTNDKLIDYWNQRKQERADRRARGTPDVDVPRPGAEQTDPDGDGQSNPDPEADRTAREAAEIMDEVGDIDPGDIGNRSIIQQLRQSFATRLAGGAAAAVGVLCSVRAFGQEANAVQHANIILPMMRMGAEVITTGNQVMHGNDVNMDELGSIMSDFYDEETQKDFFAARSIQAELGQDPTGPDLPTSAKPARVGEDPPLISFINGIPGIGGVCGVSDGIGNIIAGIPGISQVSNWFSSLASGTLEAAVGVSLEDIAGWVIDFIGGGSVDLFAQGAELGNIANYGARLAANDQAIGMAGTELTDTQTAQLDSIFRAGRELEYSQESFFARTFNIHDSRSMAGLAIRQVPDSPTNAIASIFSAPLKLFSSLSFTSASAQTSESYDYGFNEFGFSLQLQEDPRFQNPFESAEALYATMDSRTATEQACLDRGGTPETCDVEYSNLNEFNTGTSTLSGRNYDKYSGEKCFATQINDDMSIQTSDSKRYDEIPEECQSQEESWLRYRFFIIDVITEHTLACYEGEESSCQQFGNAVGTTGGGSLGVSPDGFVFPVRATKSVIINNSASRWCYQSQINCHHDYNAADIFVPTGTSVVAARGGTIVSARDNDGSSVGSRVTIKGDDGNLYYYAHMGDGTIVVTTGSTVTAGQEIGKVGTRADAVGTDMHLHFDVLPQQYSARPSCSGNDCTAFPFINVQPALISAFNALSP